MEELLFSFLDSWDYRSGSVSDEKDEPILGTERLLSVPNHLAWYFFIEHNSIKVTLAKLFYLNLNI